VDQGFADAQLQLGSFYERGYGTDQDWTKAIEWYTKASNRGNMSASYHLGIIYHYGTRTEVDYQLAFHYYQVTADQECPEAQLQLADMYHRGLGVEKDSGLAIQLCSKIRNKNGDIWITLGEIYHSADAQFQDIPRPLNAMNGRRGVNKNHALKRLGLLHEHGDYVNKNYEKVLEYYTLSRYRGNKGAYYNIALLYYYGKGVSRDFFASFEYFEQVLEGNCEEGATYVLVEDGSESNSYSDEQKKKYSFVSERIIHGEAHFYLGIMNEKGQGTCQDHEKALYHFGCSYSHGIDRAKEFLEL
jgi:TPR repeat protein